MHWPLDKHEKPDVAVSPSSFYCDFEKSAYFLFVGNFVTTISVVHLVIGHNFQKHLLSNHGGALFFPLVIISICDLRFVFANQMYC